MVDTILAELGGLVNVGAGALLVLVMVMIFRGKLVPKPYYDEMRQDRDAHAATVAKQDETIAELLHQVTELVEAGRTTKRAIEALPQGGRDG